MGERRLHADVSEEAHAGWMTFAADEGATYAAIMEAIGVKLRDTRYAKRVAQTPMAQRLLKEARQITAERRKRQAR